ncbi:MAG TPA: peptidoglycan-binding protein [Chthoniobacterales bacterium]|nr:peptidoglycan-binding protein [Chthoniobacterales bacterium]
MKKLIAILTAACFTLATGANAAKPADQAKGDTKKSAPKAKTVAPRPQAAPKQPKAPKTSAAKELRKAPAAPTKEVKTVSPKNIKPEKAPKLDKSTVPGPTDVVADDKLRKNAKATTAKVTKVNAETLNQIKAKHVNFKAKPNMAIATAQFNPNYRIAAAQNWSGPQYEVFRTYQPQWHDRSWWSSRYATVSLIGGGWYYWDAGYWFPAWGYDDGAAYYPYDGPIYVGSNPRPFDQVVADVQAVLQEQGFYRGEIDGLVGPLTREALAAYQSAAGLPPTAAIDEPTLDSLGLT